jgi:hypothetical protein
MPFVKRRPQLIAKAAIATVTLLLLAGGAGIVPSLGQSRQVGGLAAVPSSPLASEGSILPTLDDGGQVKLTVSGQTSVISDSVASLASTGNSRAYRVVISVTHAWPHVPLVLESNPLRLWGQPDQMPGGIDNLPPPGNWTWSVSSGGIDDTANWSYAGGVLARQIDWVPGIYVVTGHEATSVVVTVAAKSLTGARAPGIGVVLSPGSYGWSTAASDSRLTNLTRALSPGLERISLSGIGSTYSWSGAQNQVLVNFSLWDSAYTLANVTHARVLFDFPVGTWGDGNNLPAGTPVNFSDPVPFEGGLGYFPTTKVYSGFVQSLVAHVKARHELVTYWSVGNEVPLVNSTIVAEYIRLFNVAASVIRSTYAHARVGSDVMTRSATYLPTFAKSAQHVGFLSFHYYTANQICMTANQTYCVPNGTSSRDPTNPEIWANSSSYLHKAFMPPGVAQREWHNLTGQWLPIFDAESNLNAAGGPYTAAGGTDPRIPTSFGAAWIVAQLVAGAAQNLSYLTYFAMNGPDRSASGGTWAVGGWGFGMTTGGAGGTPEVYAPYWSLSLWSKYVPAHAVVLSAQSSLPSVVQAFAVKTSRGVSIVLVNGVNATVQVAVRVTGGIYTSSMGRAVDRGSYLETFDPGTDSVSLVRSGSRPMANAVNHTGTLHLTMFGYGVAFVQEVANATVTPQYARAMASGTSMQPDGSGKLTHFDAGVIPANRGTLATEAPPTPFGSHEILAQSTTLDGRARRTS